MEQGMGRTSITTSQSTVFSVDVFINFLRLDEAHLRVGGG
jgi:hypothetical protein